MTLQIKLALEGNLTKYADLVKINFLTGLRDARDIFGTRLKLALRDDVRSGGLGDRVANAWQYKGYPWGNKLANKPAGVVYSNAPLIITAFSNDTTIVGTGHKGKHTTWLAIPTENTPRWGRRLARPPEVEDMFSQDLIFIPGRGGQLLAFVDVVKAKSGRGFRRATKRRTGAGRKNELVLMFVFVRQVHLRKRLNWQHIAAEAQDQWQSIVAERVAQQLKNAHEM